MGDFRSQTLPRHRDGHRYDIELHEDWEVWGPNGGYLSALLLRAVGLEAASQVPASYAGQYLQTPEFGSAEISVSCMKAGRQASAWQAQLWQQGKLMVQAQVWTYAVGSGLSHQLLPRPEHWMPLAEAGSRPPTGNMRFWKNLEIRGVKNSAGHYSHWYRFTPETAIAVPYVDAARSLVLIDTMLWPARYYMESDAPLYVAPSLDLYVQFHRFNPTSHWLFSDALSQSAEHGVIGGTATVWDEGGCLLASGGGQSILRKVAAPY